MPFEDLATRIGALLTREGLWMPGMLATNGAYWRFPDGGLQLSGGYRPDLTDPATCGCLYSVLRERWPDAVVYPPNEFSQPDWWMTRGGSSANAVVQGPTLGEALGAAILEAWEEDPDVSP